MKQSIGEVVKNKRISKKMTKSQLAKKLKLSLSYIGHIERNSPVRLSERIRVNLKYALGLSIPKEEFDKHNNKAVKVLKKYPSAKKNYSS